MFKKFLVAFLFLCVWSGPAFCGETIVMKIVFENPSEIEDKKDVFKSYMPPEVTKDDVLDAGGLKLDYDPARALFYLDKEMTLKPGEKQTFKVKIRNLWKIPDDEIAFVRAQAEERFKAMEGTEGGESARSLRDKILGTLEEIKAMQNTEEVDALKNIEAYRVNRQRLKDIRGQVTLVKDFKQEAEIEADAIKYPKEVKFVINVKNASETDARTEKVVHYLPEGIRPDQILDYQGFRLQFDAEKKQYYLEQKIELKPKETKKFEIKIVDRWFIAKPKLDNFEERANHYNDYLKGTEFEQACIYLLNDIKKYIREINDVQARVGTMKDKIANFSENMKRVEAIKADLAEMERMAEIQTERLKKKQLEDLLKRLAPDEFLTWKIIYGTIAFLGVISLMTYMLWWGQSKNKLSKEYEDITQNGPNKK